MKIWKVYLSSIIILIIGLVLLVIASTRDFSSPQDTVSINFIASKISSGEDFSNIESTIPYTVLDEDNRVLYQTNNNITNTISDAYKHYDTVITLQRDGQTVNIIFYNTSENAVNKKVTVVSIIASSTIVIEGLIFSFYFLFLKKRILVPFKKLESFAQNVSEGNLNVPLEMDRDNIFGSFTESFDIMRSKLETAREKEYQASESKKELVAKISHDIKTPIASIITTAELGEVSTTDKTAIESYSLIGKKAMQINTLLSNLLNSTLEELQALDINILEYDSRCLYDLIKLADAKSHAIVSTIPECLICYDRVRINQVLENIFSNSNKYANTKIYVDFKIEDKFLIMSIEDEGRGVSNDELMLIMRKYKRGSNTNGIEGSGLGLYISNELMQKMHGKIIVSNGKRGFLVQISIPLA